MESQLDIPDELIGKRVSVRLRIPIADPKTGISFPSILGIMKGQTQSTLMITGLSDTGPSEEMYLPKNTIQYVGVPSAIQVAQTLPGPKVTLS